MDDAQTVDVIVVGSGAGGMLAAIRAHDAGLKALLIERSDRYGGTSAISGGALWIPDNGGSPHPDSAARSLEYLHHITGGSVPGKKLERYVEAAPRMIRNLGELGVRYFTHPQLSYPDYYPFAPGALPSGRTMFVASMDGAELGEEFFRLRECDPTYRLFDRIGMDNEEGLCIAAQGRGWQLTLARLIFRYWTDFAWRRRTRRDRQLKLGAALAGGLRKALAERGVPLLLKTRMRQLLTESGRISGIVAEHEGQELRMRATRAVILACGGFEQSQVLRERHLAQPTMAAWSATPRDNNTGDGLLAAIEVGADTEFMDEAWWAPTLATPSREAPNTVRNLAMFLERGYPHSVAVNRLGKRFVNEACSYHQFGQAMLRDNAATGANMPCWLIFDASFRRKYALGALLPSMLLPDRKLPPDWLDNMVYRADSIPGLAAKIAVPPDALAGTLLRFNELARKGVDEDFGRGGNFHNLFYGDARHTPNRTLGEVISPPFYAVRLDLGDIGTKGGPRTDENARVIARDGQAIPGLYAIGNAAGSVMGGSYPGAGATLGAALTFACLAVADASGA